MPAFPSNNPHRIWLSHVLSTSTPAYGGGRGLGIAHEKSLCMGDSCNAVRLDLHNHLGSHVDAPLHFIADGLAVDNYAVDDWIFDHPLLVDLPLSGPELITPELLAPHLPASPPASCDLLLIRTGFESRRGETEFWEAAPGLAASLSPWIKAAFPNLRAIGVDCISISSFQHREEGRVAHRALLGAGLLLFEDLALAAAPATGLERVIALPLRFSLGDGAPCTIIGEVAQDTQMVQSKTSR